MGKSEATLGCLHSNSQGSASHTNIRRRSKATFPTSREWQHEMVACQWVDSANAVITADNLIVEMATREYHFLIRHGLAQQFLDEDAAGKR